MEKLCPIFSIQDYSVLNVFDTGTLSNTTFKVKSSMNKLLDDMTPFYVCWTPNVFYITLRSNVIVLTGSGSKACWGSLTAGCLRGETQRRKQGRGHPLNQSAVNQSTGRWTGGGNKGNRSSGTRRGKAGGGGGAGRLLRNNTQTDHTNNPKHTNTTPETNTWKRRKHS